MIKQNLKVQHIFLFKSRMNMAMIFLWNSLGAVTQTQYSKSKRKHQHRQRMRSAPWEPKIR
jgi:hypothetical protein